MSLEEGDYDSLSSMLRTMEEEGSIQATLMDRVLPSIVTTEGLSAFAVRRGNTPDGEKVMHDTLVLAMNHLLYLDYEALLVVAARYRMNQVFELLVDNGIDYRLCADRVLMEIGDRPDDTKVAMFFKFVQEKNTLEARKQQGQSHTVPLERRQKFISYIHGARSLGHDQMRLREFWVKHDHTELLLQAIAKKNVGAIEYLVFSSMCLTAENEEKLMSMALRDGSAAIIQVLLDAGVSPDVMVGEDSAKGHAEHGLVHLVAKPTTSVELARLVGGCLRYRQYADVYQQAIESAKDPRVRSYLQEVQRAGDREAEETYGFNEE
jgi:hypothetical protein